MNVVNRVDFARNRIAIHVFRGVTAPMDPKSDWLVNATMCEPARSILRENI
jgi:hypothetical protein